MKQCDIFILFFVGGGVKTYSDPFYIFWESIPPTSSIYASVLITLYLQACGRCCELVTKNWRKIYRQRIIKIHRCILCFLFVFFILICYGVEKKIHCVKASNALLHVATCTSCINPVVPFLCV